MSSEFELPASKTFKPARQAKNNLFPTDPNPSPTRSPSPEATSGAGSEQSQVEDIKEEFSQTELLAVFDEIIFSGEYSETINLRGKVPVTFRTRTAEEISDIQRQIDSSGSNLISTVESIRSLMNLKFAMSNYKGQDLSTMKPEEKVKFVERLPGPLVGMLLMALSKFDSKVAAACKEGEQNF
jgi:hypothetical protein